MFSIVPAASWLSTKVGSPWVGFPLSKTKKLPEPRNKISPCPLTEIAGRLRTRSTPVPPVALLKEEALKTCRSILKDTGARLAFSTTSSSEVGLFDNKIVPRFTSVDAFGGK